MMLLVSISISIAATRSNSSPSAPRLSAAIMMPSLNLIASTLVPVTIGCLKGVKKKS
jgi:hypothetical protein